MGQLTSGSPSCPGQLPWVQASDGAWNPCFPLLRPGFSGASVESGPQPCGCQVGGVPGQHIARCLAAHQGWPSPSVLLCLGNSLWHLLLRLRDCQLMWWWVLGQPPAGGPRSLGPWLTGDQPGRRECWAGPCSPGAYKPFCGAWLATLVPHGSH